MQLTLTTAGIAALVNAANTGTDPVLLNEVGITTVAFAPTTGLAAVPSELKRISTIGGAVVADDVMHVLLRDETADAYSLRGFGLYLEDGTLFGSFSDGTVLSTKAAAAVLLLAIDVRFSATDAALIEFGDTTFVDPPASTTTAGVIRIATNAETQAGLLGDRAVSPAGLKYVLDNSTIPDATTTIKGKVELATYAEVQDGTDNVRAVTPAGLNSRTATTARAGLVELATNAEAVAGTDTDRAVTPAGAAAAIAAAATPDASATVKGKIEIATAAEVQNGTDTERAITPAGMSARTATTTRTGLVELATNAEAVAGTDTERALTPAGGAAAIAAAATPDASATVKGKVELATPAEAISGTDQVRAVTPEGLAAAMAAAIAATPGIPKALVMASGRTSNGNCAISATLNVASVYRSAEGTYAVSFTDALPNANYIISPGLMGVNDTINVLQGTKSQWGFSFRTQTGQANDGNGPVDPPEIYIAVFTAPAPAP